MARSDDPKHRNSRFLQFLSKMSQGQGAVNSPTAATAADGAAYREDAQILETAGMAEDTWAGDFARSMDAVNLNGITSAALEFNDPIAAQWAREYQVTLPCVFSHFVYYLTISCLQQARNPTALLLKLRDRLEICFSYANSAFL